MLQDKHDRHYYYSLGSCCFLAGHAWQLKYFPQILWLGFQAAGDWDTVQPGQRLPKKLLLEVALLGRTAKIQHCACLIHLLHCNFIDFKIITIIERIVCSQSYALSSSLVHFSAVLSYSAVPPIDLPSL